MNTTQLNSIAGIGEIGARMPLIDRVGPATQGRDPRALFIKALDEARGSGEASEARKAAEQFVANVFVEPVFKQMRESNQAAPPFAPGDAEKQFGTILDRRLSQEIVQSSSWGLVDRIAADLGDRGQKLTKEWSA